MSVMLTEKAASEVKKIIVDQQLTALGPQFLDLAMLLVQEHERELDGLPLPQPVEGSGHRVQHPARHHGVETARCDVATS